MSILKKILLALGIFLGLGVVVLTIYALPRSPWWPSERIVLGLPYRINEPPVYFEPMGETINHPKPQVPYGHPGIDFKWDESVDVLAVADGKVESIHSIVDHETDLVNISIRSGKYAVSYDELGGLAPGIEEGSHIQKGQVIGYIHPEFLQMHWDFGHALPITEPLCPMTYFDSESAHLLQQHWDEGYYKARDQFPDICSGDFANRN